MRKMRLKTSWLTGAAMLLLCLHNIPKVWAEGRQAWAGAFGANRVVRTRNTASYRGVRGTFTIPEFQLPVRFLLNPDGSNNYARPQYNPGLTGVPGGYAQGEIDDYERIATETGRLSSRVSNTQNSKPSFYVGGRIMNQEIDGGLQYEWLVRWGQPPGWGVFLSVNTGFHAVGPVEIDGILRPYRAGPGTDHANASQFGLRLQMDAANNATRVMLTVSPSPTTNEQAATLRAIYDIPNVNINQATAINVKRTVAITQRGPAVLDGSAMTGCKFSEGQVREMLGGGTVWRTWGISRNGATFQGDVDQTMTGYIPGAGSPNVGINGRDRGRPPRFVVDFPEITAQARSNDPGVVNVTGRFAQEDYIRGTWHDSQRMDTWSRYRAEQVDIYLRTGRRVRGYTVTPPGRR